MATVRGADSRPLALALAAALAGCGGGDPAQRITCAWFEGANCWRASVAAAHACVDGALTGTFDAGTTSCSFTDGASIAFLTPADQSAVSDGLPWRFDVAAPGGATCASLRETDDSLVVTTSLGTFRQELRGTTLTYACPDGSRFQIDALDALGCDFGTLPGTAWVASGGTVAFSLLPGPAADPSFWTCGP